MPNFPAVLGNHSAWCLVVVEDQRWTETHMSDYRNQDFDYRDPEDPFRRDAKMDPDVRTGNAVWGWTAAAVFLAVVLAIAFGYNSGQPGSRTASNDVTPPAAMAPPVPTPAPTFAPASPTPSAPTIAPAPDSPAQRGNTQ
jgi:hypothetical protein